MEESVVAHPPHEHRPNPREQLVQVVAAEPLQAPPRISWRMAFPALSLTAGEKLVNSLPRLFKACLGLNV